MFTLVARPLVTAPEAHDSWSPITTRDLRADERLAQKVTVLGPRKFVGEVLEVLSERTGLSITPHDVSGAADPRLLVWVKAQPAWKTMSALASLFSYRHSEWYWERRGDAMTGVYRLVQPRNAQGLAERLQVHAQAEFERVTSDMITATYRSPEESTRRLSDPEPVGLEERSGWGGAAIRSKPVTREAKRGP